VPGGADRRADRETAQLLSVAILQPQMKLHDIANSELRDLCDAMMPGDGMCIDRNTRNLGKASAGVARAC
jgi:hypothetical protein